MRPPKNSERRKVFLVTGAGGFLGACLVRFLVRRYPQHLIVATARKKKSGVRAIQGVRWVSGDLRDTAVWKKIPNTITHVFHLAARIPYAAEDRNDSSVLEDNLAPVIHLIKQTGRWKGLEQIIYSSSISVYGTSPKWKLEGAMLRPAGHYGSAKRIGEELLQSLIPKGIQVACLRLSSMYGPGQYAGTVLPMMLRDARTKGRVRVFGKGLRSQDFLHVEDAVLGLVTALERRAGGVFNIGCGRPVSMLELAGTIRRVFNGGVKVEQIHAEKESDPGNKIIIRQAQKELGFVPQVSLEEGLRRLICESRGVW